MIGSGSESVEGIELVDMNQPEGSSVQVQDELIVEGENNVQKNVGGNSSKVGAYFNFVNSIVGAGIIGLPYAINECGFVFGFVLLILVGWMTYIGVQTIINCGEEVQADNYEALCERTMGRFGFYAASFSMFTFAFGAMCAYMIIIGDTIPHVFQQAFGVTISRQAAIGVLAVIVILPLSLLKDMSKLAKTSSLSVFAAFLIVLFVVARGPSLAREDYAEAHNITLEEVVRVAEEDFAFIKSSFPAGLGAISFAYVCHHSSFIVFNTLKVRTKHEWKIVSQASIATALLLSVLICFGGYLTFYSTTQDDILENYSDTDLSVNIARLMLALTMVFTFPMEQFVARHSLNTMFWQSEVSDLKHYSVSLLLWGSSLLIGLVVEDLGFVLELTGSFSASMLGYVLPSACYFKLHPLLGGWIEVKKTCFDSTSDVFKQTSLLGRFAKFEEFIRMIFLFVFGWVALLAGTITSILQVVPSSSTPSE